MAQSQPLDIKLSGLLRVVLPLMAVVGVVGGLPTWRLKGAAGIWAEVVAVCGVLLVMVLNGKLTVLAARQSDRAAFIVFTGGSVARAMVCPLVVFLPGWLLKLPVITMCVWLAITYLLCLITECIWIVIALKKHVAIHKPRKTAPKVQPNYMDWSIQKFQI